MKLLARAFTKHPETVGESYFSHMRSALGFAGGMLAGGLACLLHGIFPFLFPKTGSKVITRLHTRMVTHRVRHAEGKERVTEFPAQASTDV